MSINAVNVEFGVITVFSLVEILLVVGLVVLGIVEVVLVVVGLVVLLVRSGVWAFEKLKIIFLN